MKINLCLCGLSEGPLHVQSLIGNYNSVGNGKISVGHEESPVVYRSISH